MFEELESIYEIECADNTMRDSLSRAQCEYINECVECVNTSALVDRIDELCECRPPKAIDSNSEVADIIEPMKDKIDSKYLEAPSDIEQIQQISDYMAGVDELKFDNWQVLSPSERLEVLQKAENKIAEIEHRESCPIITKDMPEGHFGYYSPNSKAITINVQYIYSADFNSYKETLDTLIHEGRHAYQDYNISEREVHPRSGELANWKWNEDVIGYQSAELFGFKTYAMQPVETDARAFANDILNRYINRTA